MTKGRAVAALHRIRRVAEDQWALGRERNDDGMRASATRIAKAVDAEIDAIRNTPSAPASPPPHAEANAESGDGPGPEYKQALDAWERRRSGGEGEGGSA